MSRLWLAFVVLAFALCTISMGAACVDTKRLGVTPGGSPDNGSADASVDAIASPALDASLDSLPGPEPCTDSPAADGGAASGLYAWKNVTILGGGFVSGIEFSRAPRGTDVIYARTDVGGAYRWDANLAPPRWTPITDWVGRDNSNLTGIESIAPDPVDPNVVYVAAGEYVTAGNGVMLRSGDRGDTWTQNSIPVPMGGNMDGRSVGERLSVDPNLPSNLYFASRNSGLWRSVDSAASWSQVSFPGQGTPVLGTPNVGLTLILFDKRAASPGLATSTIYVGVATSSLTSSNACTTSTAPSLYRTTDGGSTWQPVPGQPPNLVPNHSATDDASGILYFTFNNCWGPSYATTGAVWKLETSNDAWTDISPGGTRGYGGVTVDPAHPGTVVVSTLDRYPDEIYRTTDGGANWTAIGPQAVRDAAGAVWMYWHAASPKTPWWVGDIELDPNHPGRVLYNTGGGIWWTEDITSADVDAPTHWAFQNVGLEETVATAPPISPPGGAHLLTAVGDIAGFRHDNLDVSPLGGMFDTPIFGNTTGIDFAEQHPSLIARVGTTGTGNTTHHGAYSVDGGTTWSPFAAEPTGATSGAGSIAVSASGATLVWAPQGGGRQGAAVTPAFSTDRGNGWSSCSGLPSGARVAADRVNPNKFYAVAGTTMYASTDAAMTFVSKGSLPRGSGLVRPVSGIEGDLWLGATGGLYHSTDSGATFAPVSGVQSASAVGFGRGATCQDYPVVYLTGVANSVSGTYRSDDRGASWTRIDDTQHQYGTINFVAGDPRLYGRVYLATNGRGILYGDPR
jgi:hypothetical protein